MYFSDWFHIGFKRIYQTTINNILLISKSIILCTMNNKIMVYNYFSNDLHVAQIEFQQVRIRNRLFH